MEKTYDTSVEKYWFELVSQLASDGLGNDHVSVKTAKRLRRLLKKDGFTFEPLITDIATAKPVIVSTPAEPVIVTTPVESKKSTRGTKLPKLLSNDDIVVKAFRAKNTIDATIIGSVFGAIDGWKTKTIEHNGSHFVIVSNAPRLTDKRTKAAIYSYVADLKESAA